MLSKNKIKLIRSLEQKKRRREEGLFVAEGPKVVGDLLEAGYKAKLLVCTNQYFSKRHLAVEEVIEVSDDELRKVSFLQHPQDVLGVFEIPNTAALHTPDPQSLCIALDGVQDPGNLGTIIRIADWFGINQIFCSTDTADAFNPKTVQATMGSIARVIITYTDLRQFFDTLPAGIPVYGTLLDGKNIYEEELTEGGIIEMGNEGNGISEEIRQRINRRLLIPNYPQGRKTADSLNVAIATAITCNEFRRRTIKK